MLQLSIHIHLPPFRYNYPKRMQRAEMLNTECGHCVGEEGKQIDDHIITNRFTLQQRAGNWYYSFKFIF